MALPALHLLQQAGYPLILVGRPWAKDLLAGLEPYHFIALQGPWRRDAQTLRKALSGSGAPAHPGNNRTPSGPAGICFPDSLSSALVFRWAGVRTAGYRDDGRSLLLTWPVAKPKPRPHVVASYYYLARNALLRWGHDNTPEQAPPTLALPLTSAHQQAAVSVIERAGLAPGRFVLLSPTATGLHKGRIKAWGHYGELALSLQQAGWAVAMCPPPQEVDAARQAAPGALLLPALPLGAYAALTRMAALVVCNDSGTSHVAAAAAANQLTLFGVTQPERTGPWSPRAVCLGTDHHWPTLQAVVQAAQHQLQSASA